MGMANRIRLSNPALLTWARETAGYSAADIGRSVGKDETTVLAWEAGAEAPTYRQLEGIARKVRRPVAAFFLPEVPATPSAPDDFRTMPGVRRGEFGPQALLAFRSARNALTSTRELVDELGLDIAFSLPALNGRMAPAHAARSVRDAVGVSVAA